jgi:hypothetical protein
VIAHKSKITQKRFTVEATKPQAESCNETTRILFSSATAKHSLSLIECQDGWRRGAQFE